MITPLPAGAPDWARTLVRQLNTAFDRIRVPQAPVRLLTVADVASLPPAADWKGCILFCEDVGSSTPGLVYSDGADWRRADTNATL